MLLDTNVLSELRKVRSGKTSPAFIRWESTVKASQLMLSVITLQELEVGILRLERKEQQQARILREWFTNYVQPEFRHRILPVTKEIAYRSAMLLVDSGRSCEDALIAATAYVHKLPVVTLNVKHFKDTGVKIINPWEEN
jgi:predicted nucleic acid-binding protein